MSEHRLPPSNEPLRIAVRRLRWFKAAFIGFAQEMGRELGCAFVVDEPKLVALFVRWLRAVERQKPSDKTARAAYFEFAAGLMLREFTADMPLTPQSPPRLAAPNSAAAFWPEGYVVTLFCLTLHAAATREEFQHQPMQDPAIEDLRQWWSFRENIREDHNFSIGFLQMMLGHQPNWAMPDVFRARLGQELGTPRA